METAAPAEPGGRGIMNGKRRKKKRKRRRRRKRRTRMGLMVKSKDP